MKRGEKMLICTVAGLTLCTAANAATSESPGSPYQRIVARNVFNLSSPPPPPDPAANKPPPPKIFLQGITTFGGTKRALFKAQMPPKPGEPAKGEQSFILAEGQRDGDMEVVAIDANPPGSVKVSAFDTIITLDFEHNGIKTTTAAPGPSAAPRPGMGVPPPGAPGAHPAMPAGGAQPFPNTRPMRLPLPGAAASSAYGGGVTPVYATGNAGGTPGVPVGGMAVPLYNPTPVQTQPQPQVAQPAQADTMTAEEKFLMVEAYRAKLKQTGADRIMPPIPPTPLTHELNPPTPPAAQ